jgi:hypothetical protein
VTVPSQESDCFKSHSLSWLGTVTSMNSRRRYNIDISNTYNTWPLTFLAWYSHFHALAQSLSWFGTVTFLASGKWLYQAKKVTVPSQERDCTRTGKWL